MDGWEKKGAPSARAVYDMTPYLPCPRNMTTNMCHLNIQNPQPACLGGPCLPLSIGHAAHSMLSVSANQHPPAILAEA